MNQQHRHSIQGVSRPMVWAIATGILLVSCNSTPDTAVAPSPTPTVSPTPALSPTPTISPTIASPTATPTPTASPTAAKPENVTKIETQITDLVTKAGNLTVQSVNCPTAIDEKSGKTYDCQVQSDIGGFVVVVQPTGEAGKFRWGTRGLLLLSKLDAFIQQSVANQGGGKVTVDCGAKSRTAKAGETFDCKVTDAKGAVKTARVTVRDDQGNVYLSLQ